LFLPATVRASEFPAVIRVTEDDLNLIAAGGMVNKIVYLEDPDTAIPEESKPDQPIERTALRGDDAMALARSRGRIVAVWRLGSRTLTEQELIAESVSGVVQIRGEELGPPSKPPMLPAHTFQLFDPIAGPKIPHEELVQDGGDVGPRLGIGPGGKIGNLDTTDVGAEFRYGKDLRRSATSNRICLFAPRFPIIREEITPAGFDGMVSAFGAISTSGVVAHRTRQPVDAMHENIPPMATIGKLSVHKTEMREGTRALDLFVGAPLLLGRIDGTNVKAVVLEPVTLTQYKDHCKSNEPLVVVKSADPKDAHPGDIVTITLRFINYGNRPARELALSDNLSPRLEYVPGSSKGDRPTIFTMQNNEAGSSILRWEIVGEIPPGQSGVVQFQVKVR
jgi:uncharacterized repeat protein (TIGR01451 family)